MVLWVPDCSTDGESGGEREKQYYSVLLSWLSGKVAAAVWII